MPPTMAQPSDYVKIVPAVAPQADRFAREVASHQNPAHGGAFPREGSEKRVESG